MLKNYLWECFELAESNEKPVNVGVDLLAHNLDHLGDSTFYFGAPELDYVPMAAQWENMTPYEQMEEKNEAISAVRGHYSELCAAWMAQDRAAFDAALAR